MLIMDQYIDVAVAAINLRLKKHLEAEDRHVPAVYVVSVLKKLSAEKSASVALDVFHSTVPVGNLDDFVFLVFDPLTGRILPEDDNHEAYSGSNLGCDCERISDRLPRLYEVDVRPVRGGALSEPLVICVACDNKGEAKEKAKALTSRLHLIPEACQVRCIAKRMEF